MYRFAKSAIVAVVAAGTLLGFGGNAEAGSSVDVSGSCSGWIITDKASDTVWENAEFFTVDNYQKGAAPGRGESVMIADQAYQHAGFTDHRVFMIRWIMADGTEYTSQQIEGSRDLSDCPRAPAPKFEAQIVCSATSGTAVYSLMLSGDWQRFISFELNGMKMGNGTVIPNAGGTVHGYYAVGYGPNDVAMMDRDVQPAKDCTPVPVVTEPAPEPTVTTVPSTTPVVITVPTTTTPVAIYPTTASVSYVRHCDGTYSGNLYIAREGDLRPFGFWYNDSPLGEIPADQTVVNFSGHTWPVTIQLTNASTREISVIVKMVTEDVCEAAGPVDSTTSTTVVAPASSVTPSASQMLPATGSRAEYFTKRATLVLALGVILLLWARRPKLV